MRKIWVLCLILTALSFTVLGQTSQNYSIDYTGSGEGNLEISEIDRPELKYDSNKVLFSFNVDRTEVEENQDVYLKIEENPEWFRNGISRNSVQGFRGPKVKSTPTFRENESVRILLEGSDNFYLIGLNSTSTWDFYLSEGECSILLNPGRNDLRVDSCNSILSKLYTLQPTEISFKALTLLLSLMLLSVSSLFLLPKILEKMVLRKNNLVMKKAAEFNDVESRNSMLKRLMTADEAALEGDYLKAYRIIREIEDTIED